MNRRSFFGFIAAAPLLPIAAKAEPWAEPQSPVAVNNSARVLMAGSRTRWYSIGAAGEWQLLGSPWNDPLVCENHHDKAWPDECDCGPGMRYVDAIRT